MVARNADSSIETGTSAGQQSLNGYAIALLALCVFVGMAEGYDAQAMAFAAPLLRTNWALQFGQIGLLMSASAMGLVVGSFLLSPAGDRYGRRPAIMVGLLITGFGTGAGAMAQDMSWMLLTRVVAGLGLALAIPNGWAMSLELVPARLRSLAVVLVLCGYPLGAALGAAIVSVLVPHLGYAAVFVVGAVMSFAALMGCATFLPESPSYLVRHAHRKAELEKVTGKLGYAVPPQDAAAVVSSSGNGWQRAKALFIPERRLATVLFWLMNLGNVAMIYFYVGWLPSLFVGPNLDAQAALRATSLFSATGAIGAVAMVLVMKRAGPVPTLCVAYVVAMISTLVLAYSAEVGLFVYLALGIAGVTVTGSSFCLSAIVAVYYPSDIRATASGFATGIGRAGAVLTPLIVGVIMGASAPSRQSFAFALAPALIALIAALVFEIAINRRQTLGKPATT